MSLPWFPFWVDDFLASPKVRMMTMEEIGVYVMLLCEQHQNGRVEWPNERTASALRTDSERIEYVLGQCFKKDRHGFYSPRLRQINAEQTAKSGQASKAAKARWSKGFDTDASPPHERKTKISISNPEPEPEPDTDTSSAEDVVAPHVNGSAAIGFAHLDPLAQQAIKGLYGWGEDRIGMDEKVWGTITDHAKRAKLLEIATARLQGEGMEYNGRLFRRILETVITEGSTNTYDPSIWED